MPPKNAGRRGRTLSRRVPGARTPRLSSEHVVQQLNDPVRASVCFADPLSTDQPSTSTAQASEPIAQVQAPTPSVAVKPNVPLAPPPSVNNQPVRPIGSGIYSASNDS